MTNGQKIYIFDYSEERLKRGEGPIVVATGYICPRIGEIISIFDPDENVFNMYEVAHITHGCRKDNPVMVTTIHANLVKTQPADESK